MMRSRRTINSRVGRRMRGRGQLKPSLGCKIYLTSEEGVWFVYVHVFFYQRLAS